MNLRGELEAKTQAAETEAEREARLERAAIEAGAIDISPLEGPEAPDIFAEPTQVEPTTKAPEDQAPAELIQAPEVATQSPLDAIPEEDRQQVRDNIDDYESSGFSRDEATNYALEDYKSTKQAEEEERVYATQETKKADARKVAQTNFDSAIDQVDSAEYGGNIDAAFEAYRQNLFDTLNEQGLTKGEDRDLVLNAADREFENLVADYKAKQPKETKQAEAAPFDAQATVAKIEDEGVYHSYNTATEALAQGDEIYALDVDNEFDIANTLNSDSRLLSRFLMPQRKS
jgi:hypothetical protein